MTSSVSVMSSPFAQPRAAAAQALRRPRLDHPLARQILGEGLACRALAGKSQHIGGPGHSLLGRDLILSGRTLELLEGQLDLVEQPHSAFRALAMAFAPKRLMIRDLQ
jgi:hypothetical protein